MSDFDMSEGARGRAAGIQRLITLSGAVVSLSLIGGMGLWGYKLLVRDVTGVPVVQAMEGDFRTAPEDPGGTVAEHQELAVNEIAAEGSAGGPAEEVALAPGPVTLTEEDVPMPQATAAPASDEAAPSEPGVMAATDEDLATDDEAADVEIATLEEGEAETAGVVDDLPDGALATDRAVAEALMADLGSDYPKAEITLASATADAVPGGRSPRPAPRPAAPTRIASLDAADGVAAAAANTGEVSASGDVDLATLEVGTRMAQLGAFETPEIAREQWTRIAARFEDYFVGKQRVIQEAEAGGKAFYRLRAVGFDDLSDSRRFCSALMAGKADCIPVELR